VSTQALTRDGYQCVLTGKLDAASIDADLAVDDGSLATATRAAHIFDRSTIKSFNAGNKVCYPFMDLSYSDAPAI